MPLAKCPRCSKMFNKLETPVCPACMDDEEADYEKIRKLVQDNPNLNPQQVSEQTDVDVAVVRRMLDQGVITSLAADETPICGMCGAPAISMAKKLCEKCLQKLNTDVVKAQQSIRQTVQPKKSPQLGMYSNPTRPGGKHK